MKAKTVCVTSKFPASTDEIWKRLQRLDTLQYIAAPYATFKPVNKTSMQWKEGETSKFHLMLFGFISMGIHTINVIRFDKSTFTVYTNESNKNVPVWNHRIVLKKINKGLTDYTDEVEIYAGWKTPFVFIWSNLFYRHRQRKWLKLLYGQKESGLVEDKDT